LINLTEPNVLVFLNRYILDRRISDVEKYLDARIVDLTASLPK
jgi:hypothetical protein